MKSKIRDYFKGLQDSLCKDIEAVENQGEFVEEVWKRDDIKATYGGGGRSRSIIDGEIFEKAGINFSEVQGTLPKNMSKKLIGVEKESNFYATGVSLVFHPRSPHIPTTHANVRYIEVENKKWFGGGSDLTPYYIYDEDAAHFHTELKKTCDKFNSDFYPKFKKECDQYFYLKHRKESRGIGGIFYDYLGKNDCEKLDSYFDFTKAIGETISKAYIPIAERRKKMDWSTAQKDFQLHRRGRYVEFNLLYDRGTHFGLSTGGRTESIFMSFPPSVSWKHTEQVKPGSPEAYTLEIVKNPRDWA